MMKKIIISILIVILLVLFSFSAFAYVHTSLKGQIFIENSTPNFEAIPIEFAMEFPEIQNAQINNEFIPASFEKLQNFEIPEVYINFNQVEEDEEEVEDEEEDSDDTENNDSKETQDIKEKNTKEDKKYFENPFKNAFKRISILIEKTKKMAGSNEFREQLDEAEEKADDLNSETFDNKKEAKSALKDFQSILKDLKKIRNKIKYKDVEIITEDYVCPENYDLTKNTIIFYYTDEPHSNAMMPIIEELEQTYSFYKTDDLWNKKASKCLEVVGSTPTFVCAGTNEKLVGEVSNDKLMEFIEECTNS